MQWPAMMIYPQLFPLILRCKRKNESNTVAIIVDVPRTITLKHDNHNHNEQQHNHLRFSPDVTSTIQMSSYTANYIDPMVEYASCRQF